ncbi:MAG: YegS/Rv2252/BmrU family lipid kinase [Candidatus Eremiobacteraeota bacterium]|nr:YegS/Rv2252/BmrU family lipid kinase [Candidatus Eremiobacteraeota bacterium]
MMAQAVLVARSGSRYGAADLPRAAKLLSERGVTIGQSHVVPSREALRKCIKDAVRSHAAIVVVCGGDGSQSAAVDVLACTDTVLGIIPAGTGNSFARSLHIEPTLEGGADVVAGGNIALIDLPCANGTYFANFATVGLAAQIGDETPRLLKRMTGPLAYALSGIAPILFHRPFDCTIKWDGKKSLKMMTDQIIVGRYFGAKPIIADANPFDGRLGFFATRAAGSWNILRSYFALLRGTPRRISDAHCFAAKKIKVRTDHPQPVSLDGSEFGETPVRFTVTRRALRVFVPRELTVAA